MAKFTASVALNIRLPNGEELIGAAGTTHRFSDALVDEFVRDVVPHIPGFAWVVQDETSAISGGASTSVAAETTYGISSTAGTAASFSRGDHTHGSPSLATTAASTLAIGNSASTGTATLPARADHAHGLPAFAAVTAATSYGISSADGTAATVARSDHTHGSVANPIISGSGFTVASGTFSAASAAIVGSGLSVLAGYLALSASSQALVVPGLLRTGGASFPASPATNDGFYRTDLGMEFFYNGTRWLSTTLHHILLNGVHGSTISGTNSNAAWAPTPLAGCSDIWIEDATFWYFISSPLSTTQYWAFDVEKAAADTATFTDVSTITVNSGSTSVNRSTTNTVDALLNNGTTHYGLRLLATATGGPGAAYIAVDVTFRMVAT